MTVQRVDGVDLSHWQTGSFSPQVAGIKWLYHKATEGVDHVDKRYAKVRASVTSVPTGAYHFARPSLGSGRRQAQHFLKNAKLKPGDLLPMLDLEDRGGMNQAQLTAWVRSFVDEVRFQMKVTPIIYTPFDLDSTFGGALLWVARYSNLNHPPRVPSPWKRWDIWQFSDGTFGRPNRLPGFPFQVDLNTMRAGLTVDQMRIPHKERLPILPKKWNRGAVAHFSPYRFNNSDAGSRLAARRKFKWVDNDFQVTSDNVFVNTHWGIPAKDGASGLRKRVESYTWNVLRPFFRSGTGAISTNAKLSVGTLVEMKKNPGFTRANLRRLFSFSVAVYGSAAKARENVITMTIANWGDSRDRLTAAHKAGFNTIILNAAKRGKKPSDYASWICDGKDCDYPHPDGRPMHVVTYERGGSWLS